MITINPFDPTMATSGRIIQTAVNPCSVVYLVNQSPIILILTFPNGDRQVLHPWYARAFINKLPGPIDWQVFQSLGISGAPVKIVTGEIYESTEISRTELPQGPTSLLSYIGNDVPVGTSTTSVINDGNAANTVVVEATLTGSSGSNVLIENDGDLVIRQYVAAVLTDLFKIISGVASGGTNVLISDINHVTSILGKLIVKDHITASGDIHLGRNGVESSVLDTGGGDTYLKAASGAILFHVNGIQKAAIGNDITFPNGSRVTGMNQFSGTGTGTYNHNSGGTPQWIGVQHHASGSATTGINTITSTTVNVVSGTNNAFTALAVRYT